jgi:Domain of unknown function (DUF4351)
MQELELAIRQLTRRIGNIPDSVRSQIQALPLEILGNLCEDLLDFTNLRDLEVWLEDAQDLVDLLKVAQGR